MRPAASILLIAVFVLLGTGALEYLHNLDHAREDAIEDARAGALGAPVSHHHQHDESNCEVHAQLHMPALPTAWVQVLIFLGLWTGFLTLRQTQFILLRLRATIDCRGPPVA